MDIVFKGRHTTVQDRFREHATVKLAKLERLEHKAIRYDVEVSKESNPRQNGRRERVELTIRSRGPAIRAEAAADDRFAALDLALAKLEARLRRACDRRKARHGVHNASAHTNGHSPNGHHANGNSAVSEQPAPPPGMDARDLPQPLPDWPEEPADSTEASADGDMVHIEMEGDGPLVVRQKFHSASPMTIDQALFEMELVGHDFYLFQDKETGRSSVVYRRCGYQYGVIRLVEEQVPGASGPSGHLVAS